MVLVKVVKISKFLKSAQRSYTDLSPTLKFPLICLFSFIFRFCCNILKLMSTLTVTLSTPPQVPLLLKSNMAAYAKLSNLISARPDHIIYLFTHLFILYYFLQMRPVQALLSLPMPWSSDKSKFSFKGGLSRGYCCFRSILCWSHYLVPLRWLTTVFG